MTATPLPGFTVAMVSNLVEGEGKGKTSLRQVKLNLLPLFQLSELKGEADSEKENMFKMYHTRKTYYFQASKKEDAVRLVHQVNFFTSVSHLLSLIGAERKRSETLN